MKLRLFLQQYKQLAISKYLYEVFVDADIGDSVSWIIQKCKNDKFEILTQICKNKEYSLNFAVLRKYDEIINDKDTTYILSSLNINILKLENNTEQLGDISNIIVGIKPYQTGKGNPKQTNEDVQLKKNF